MHKCMNDPDWSLYRAFLAVMTEGSLSAAARALGLTQPTLAARSPNWKRGLGVALFTRSPQGLKPTDAALDLRPPRPGHDRGGGAAGPRGVGGRRHGARRGPGDRQRDHRCIEVLPAILADFRPRHPGVAAELSLDNQQQDLLRGAADIAVRMVPGLPRTPWSPAAWPTPTWASTPIAAMSRREGTPATLQT